MPRPRSEKVAELKAKLLVRIRDGYFRPGDRFLSNRALAGRFGVSYQTAHRLIGELCAEGWIERRAASGTYIAGKHEPLTGVQFHFHPRAKRTGSFGARLLTELRARLERENISHTVSFSENGRAIRSGLFPVIWECREALARMDSGRYALLLNNPAPDGLAATFMDSVSVDDFSGGVCAAEILRARGHARIAVLGGPDDDIRSRRRVEGFLSLLPESLVAWSGGWYFEDGLKVAPRLLKKGMQALFCCNDRLAESVVRSCEEQNRAVPDLVGFDDAPIAETLNLTTIAIPWAEMVEASLTIIRRRLRGETSTAARQVLAPRPVIRA